MVIKILCFGFLDKSFYKEAFDNYANKLVKHATLEVIELKEEFNKETQTNKKQNSELLVNKLEKYQDYEIICLDVNSTQVTSEQISDMIASNINFKGGKLLFVIGPSDGFSSDFLAKKFKKISFGKITLPHQLFRVILVEQIYRAFKIINNEKYHK